MIINNIYMCVCVCVCVCNINTKVKLMTLVEGDPKAPFSIAIIYIAPSFTPWRRGGCYSISCIAPLYR